MHEWTDGQVCGVGMEPRAGLIPALSEGTVDGLCFGFLVIFPDFCLWKFFHVKLL